MRRGLVLPNWEAGEEPHLLIDAAVAAEDAGWDGIFLADHLIFPPPSAIGGTGAADDHRPFPDPWITLAGIATRTERLRLGTWITPLPRRQPWQVARDLATLDRLSGGRVILGLGLGRRPDYDRFGDTWDLPALGRRCDEALEIIDGLWSGEAVTYDGEFFQLSDAVTLPTPEQRPRIPIVVGGLWPGRAFLRRGARWDGIIPHFPGDGVLPGDGVAPEQHLRDLVTAYRERTKAVGEIMVLDAPPDAGPDYRVTCRELGVTWLLTAKWGGEWTLDLDRIAAGPPD
ncbi:MAG: LLM class flavin-dependent oxidoreductase [Nitriliruptorales bacterium]|nr:LLM class flavin-dependent oxidoreductase [Nitriliruptorales bacterium]